MECKKEQNLANCSCTADCERKGVCCECVAFHRERGEFPACLRNLFEDQETIKVEK